MLTLGVGPGVVSSNRRQGRTREISDGSVQARYTHVTAIMRSQLLDGLTVLWAAALDARRRLAATSPVPVLDRLLALHGREAGE